MFIQRCHMRVPWTTESGAGPFNWETGRQDWTKCPEVTYMYTASQSYPGGYSAVNEVWDMASNWLVVWSKYSFGDYSLAPNYGQGAISYGFTLPAVISIIFKGHWWSPCTALMAVKGLQLVLFWETVTWLWIDYAQRVQLSYIEVIREQVIQGFDRIF